MGIKFGLASNKEKQIPDEFKDLAKDFAEKGFITTSSANLINWAFSQTSQKKLVDAEQVITEVDVWLGNKPRVRLVSSKKVISLKKSNFSSK